MSFDARSLERLQQLGRSLPQPLPTPEPTPAPTPATAQRHRVETETDPQALFRELMQVSPDGTVPPHLMDRLRQAEADAAAAAAMAVAAQRRQSLEPQPSQSRSPQPGRRPGGGGRTTPRANGQRRTPASSEELELYSAFQDLLHLESDALADGETAAPAAQPPRRADDRLRTRPAERPRRGAD